MINYFIPDMPTTDQLIPYLEKIEHNCWYTNFGPLYEAFKLRASHSCFPCVSPERINLVSSGTSALELSLKSLDLPVGSKVLTTCFTFPATIEAIVNSGFHPIISDIDRISWQLTPEITKHHLALHDIAAVVPVAAFGMPVCSEQWAQFFKETGIPVIVDAAAALFNQTVNNELIYTFSLHATKPLGIGEGGLIITPSHKQAQAIQKMSNFGIEPDRTIIKPGTNAKLSEYHCAVGLAQLDRMDTLKTKRQRVLDQYLHQFRLYGLDITLQEKTETFIPSSLYVLCKQTDASSLYKELHQKNIETRRLYWPLIHDMKAFKTRVHFENTTFQNSGRVASTGLALPFHNFLTSKEIETTVDTIARLIR